MARSNLRDAGRLVEIHRQGLASRTSVDFTEGVDSLIGHVGFEEAAAFPDEDEEGLRKQCIIAARGPRAQQAASDATSEWLIFGDGSGLADRLIELLAARGERVRFGFAGKTFERVDVLNTSKSILQIPTTLIAY